MVALGVLGTIAHGSQQRSMIERLGSAMVL